VSETAVAKHPSELAPWKKSYQRTATRTYGEVGLRKNGSVLDIWIRVKGKPRWVRVSAQDVQAFLGSDEKTTVLYAESDGNAEDDPFDRIALRQIDDRW
jgi:hypothetical protein